MSHEFPVGFENLQGHFEYCKDKIPELSWRTVRDGNVRQVAENVVELTPFFYKQFQGFHAVAHDYLRKTQKLRKPGCE